VAGLVLGGVGIASVVVGAIFGARAKSEHDDAVLRCPTSPCSDEEGVRLNGVAQTSALVANVTIVAGLALTAGGFVTWVTAPRGKPAPPSTGALRLTSVAPAFGKGSGAIALTGTF
jgi:hypothetical protein